ncbi:MAG: Xaa-Pro peptidase family protein [Thermomicrobiales bacterium]
MSVTDRLERLRRSLAPEFAGAVVALPIHTHYLSGQPPGSRAPSYVVVGPGRAVLVAPGAAPGCDPAVEQVAYAAYSHTSPVDPHANAEAALIAALERAGVVGRAVAIEAEWLPQRLAAAVAARCQVGPLGDRLERQRMVKDEAELALIRRAAGIIDGAFAAVRDGLRAGRSELAVYEDAVRAILLAHGEPFTMECVFISGERTLEIIGPPTAREFAPGDLLIFDVYPYLRGYKVDVTRTFCVGPATDEQRRLHALLERALAAGAAALRPGATGGAVDAATRGVIAAAGYGAHSTHHMGHAIGLFHPERPSIVPGETLPLAEGMVITLEPGVYVPGIGGLRLEQNYVVRDGPPEALSRFPLELVEC